MQKRKWQRKQKLSLIFEHIALLNLESRWGGHYFGFPKSFVDFSGQVALFRGNWELSLKLWGSFIPLNCWRHFTFQIHTRFDWDVKLVFSMKVFEKNKTCFIGSKYLPSLEFDISVGGIGKVCLPGSEKKLGFCQSVNLPNGFRSSIGSPPHISRQWSFKILRQAVIS